MKKTIKFMIDNRILKCCHCGGENFRKQEVLLSIWWWLWFRSANVFECQKCGRLEWFSQRYTYEKGNSFDEECSCKPEKISCFNCEEEMNENDSVCKKCGWTYNL